MSDTEAILRWMGVLSLLSLWVAPLTWWLGDGLQGARFALARPLGLILVTAALWWPAALIGIPFVRLALILTTVLLGAAGWLLWWRGSREIDWRALAFYELLWLALFLGYALFRSYNPDIANTEKPMEIALLSSVSRSAEVPAPDPWFAGEAINYYYFGYQAIGTLVKLSGVPPSIAFNLALATLFASLGTAAAATGFHLAAAFGVRRWIAVLSGALTTFLLLFAGNLETVLRLVRNPGETLATGWWYDDAGWEASRIIVDHGVHGDPAPQQTINEFPAFSFVLGDLHPHVLTYPLLLVISALLIGMICKPVTATLGRLAGVGSLIGLLYVSNSWDAPVGLLLLAGALLITFGWRKRQTWYGIGVAGLAALIAALPFLTHFTAPVGVDASELPGPVNAIPILSTFARTVGIVTWRPSSAAELLIVHGHWIIAFGLFAALTLSSTSRVRDRLRARFDLLVVILLLALVVGVLWAPAVLLLGIPFGLALAIVASDTRAAIRVVAGLFATGFFLTLVPEFVYIQDVFADRMNTVFKLYFQAWLLLSIASAAAFAIALAAVPRRFVTASVFVIVLTLIAVAPYTPLSARDWTAGFTERRGLDGAEYIVSLAPDEAAATDWIDRHATASTVVVEGPGCSYGTVAGVPMNRVSAFSGVPTIIGWAAHEHQWRRGERELIGPRVEYRQTIANRWLSGERVSVPNVPAPDYVVLGMIEAMGSENCQSLIPQNVEASVSTLGEDGWRPVFRSGDVVILGRSTP